MTHVENGAGQPARVLGARPSAQLGRVGRAARAAGSGSRSSAAARRCSWPGPTPRCARRPAQGETDAFPASELPLRPLVRPRRRDHPLRAPPPRSLDLLGAAAGVDAAPPRSPPTPATPVAELADRRRRPRRWPTEQSVVQTRFPTTALALLRALARRGPRRRRSPPRRTALAAPLPVEPGDIASSRSSAAAGRRPRRGGGAEVPRGGRRLDRGVPGDGVPPRADQRERRGHRGVGVRRGACGAGRRRRGHRRALSSTTTSTRSPTWSAPSASPSSWPTRTGVTPTIRSR